MIIIIIDNCYIPLFSDDDEVMLNVLRCQLTH